MSTPILTLADAKLWLRVDHTSEDTLISALIDDATELVEARLRRPVVGSGEDAVCSDVSSVPAAIQFAALGIVALKYENRSATSQEIADRLVTNAGLDPYIDWEGADE